MDLDELRAGLKGQERFSPDLDAVRDRVRLATEPAHQRSRRRMVLRRALSVAASVAVVGALALTIAIVHSRSAIPRPAAPSASTVAGTHWQLTSASVAGMPNYGVQPDLTESLYLYPDGASVTTGFCFTRQGKWRQTGSQLVFTDQRTLQHRCALDMQDTAPQRALMQLDGPMNFTIVEKVLQLHNTGTTMTLKAVGTAPSNPGAPTGPSAKALADVTWQLASAVKSGKNVALPPGKATTMQLYSDGTSNMVAPGCFYRTGRWHTVEGGIELTDQVRPVMGCYAISNNEEVAGGKVLAGLAGTIQATVTGTTLTLESGDTLATFTNKSPAAVDATPTPASTTAAGPSPVITLTAASTSAGVTTTDPSGGDSASSFRCGGQLPAPLPGVSATPIPQPDGGWQFRLTNATKLPFTVDTLHGYAQVMSNDHGVVESLSQDNSYVLRRPTTLDAGASNVFDTVGTDAYFCTGARVPTGDHTLHLAMRGLLNGESVVFTAATFIVHFPQSGQPTLVR